MRKGNLPHPSCTDRLMNIEWEVGCAQGHLDHRAERHTKERTCNLDAGPRTWPLLGPLTNQGMYACCGGNHNPQVHACGPWRRPTRHGASPPQTSDHMSCHWWGSFSPGPWQKNAKHLKLPSLMRSSKAHLLVQQAKWMTPQPFHTITLSWHAPLFSFDWLPSAAFYTRLSASQLSWTSWGWSRWTLWCHKTASFQKFMFRFIGVVWEISVYVYVCMYVYIYIYIYACML